jgi:colanic acid/amylovoran biosynthesis glycosyltransferase
MPLRIAMFVGSFPVVSETFIVNQVTGLLELGHEVDIFAELRTASTTPEKLLSRTTFMDMPEECHPWELPIHPVTGETWIPGAAEAVSNFARLGRALPVLAPCYLKAPGLTRHLLDPAEHGYCAASLSSVYRLAKLLSTEKSYDIVHAHFGPVAKRFRFAKQLWNAPLVVTFYGYDFSAVPRKEGPGVYEKLFESVDRVIVISHFVGAEVEKLGCPKSKIAVIPLGIHTESFSLIERNVPSDSPLKVLTVARLVEKKGIDYCLRAFARVRQRFPRCEYEVVGDGPLRPKLEKLAGELGISETVQFHGAQPAEFVRAKVAEAHLFVLASVTAADGDQEGQGLVLAEAQASGLPVIATDHAALPESIVPGESGFLVPERDAERLAAKMIEVLSAPELWSRMGRAGRKFVEQKFELASLSRRLEALYIDVLKTRYA